MSFDPYDASIHMSLCPYGQRFRCTTAFRGYTTVLNQQLPQAVRGLDPFHVTKLGLTAVDQVRRRVQRDVYGHRDHRGDPLYGIRRILRRRADRLSERAWVGCGPDSSRATRAGRSPPPGPSPRALIRCY